MTPQPVAEPADEPQAALIATCANCGHRITRLALDSAKWRHDNGGGHMHAHRPHVRPPRDRRQRVSDYDDEACPQCGHGHPESGRCRGRLWPDGQPCPCRA